MAEKKAAVKITSPKGRASYPYLTKPDTQYNPDGDYKVNLIVPSTEAQALCDKLDALAEVAFKEAVAKAKPQDKKTIKKYVPYIPEYDSEGNETDNIIFKFKLNALGKDKKTGKTWKNEVKLFDAAGNLIKGDIAIYGGTILKVNATINDIYVASSKDAGVSMRMNAVQIIKLVSGGGSDNASDYGFGEEEGFTAEQQETFEDAGAGNPEEDF